MMMALKIAGGFVAFGFLYWFTYINWKNKQFKKHIQPGNPVHYYEGEERRRGRIIEYRYPVVKIRDFVTRKEVTRLTSEIYPI